MNTNAELFLIKSQITIGIIEAEQKDERPYYFSVNINSDYSAIIPIRSSFRHPYGFITGKYIEDGVTYNKGLDYSKAIIILTVDLDNIKDGIATIDNQEYQKINNNQQVIVNGYLSYIEKYKNIIKLQHGGDSLEPKQELLIRYSTLQNYHTILNIAEY